jgi:signal transduction histidine kinase
VHKETALFHQIVEQVIVTAEVESRLKDQMLKLDIAPGLKINADQYLLFSAVSNLVQNAIKYTHTGGMVRVKAHESGEQTLIEVEDECGGLKSVSPSDLFKPFEQQNKNREGLGLGLTIAHRAIALNDGTIDVKNRPGHGCVFRISLPRVKDDSPPEPVKVNDDEAGPIKKITRTNRKLSTLFRFGKRPRHVGTQHNRA